MQASARTGGVGEKRRQAILEAAQREFEQYSYGGARMQRIADTAGVPKANVHYYFGNKKTLYNAVLEEVVGLWNQAFDSLDADDDPAEVLDQLKRISDEVVAEAAGDELSREIFESFRKFRDETRQWHEISEIAYYESR